MKSENISRVTTDKNNENEKENLKFFDKQKNFQIHVVKKKFSNNINLRKIGNNTSNDSKDIEKDKEKDNCNTSRSKNLNFNKTHIKNLSFIESRETSMEKKSYEKSPQKNIFRKIK